ncbi:MAG: serine/threonine-protein kinase [Armatimonadota bacterium]|nr:serine/threonine-protein kinase [Armatimonadota bacterium]
MESSTNTLGRYQIIREIARSNDIIYEAVDPAINRHVALKELSIPPTVTGAQKRERIERFYREAKAAGSLSHPNIVTIYEVGEENGRHFIAMELLEGQDLQDVIRAGGALPVHEAVSITLQVCDALAYAHSKGVIHRDIKPDNIQMLPGGKVKITDFGIARLSYEPSITTDGQVFGTPSYMSPEQVAGKPLDHRTDIYSIGVVLYEMLAGRKPFAGDTVVTITYNIMNMEPTPPPSVPFYLGEVIRRAMAKDPNQRYTTAADMAEDLRNEKASGSMPLPADPFGAQSTGAYNSGGLPPPGGYQQPAGSYQPSAPPPDPFGSVKPGDMSLPRIPREPIISPEAKAFLGLMAVVLSLIGLFLFSIWALNAAYQGYLGREGEGRAARHIELGEKAYEQGELDAAIDHFRRAIDMAPKSPTGDTARKDLASCYIRKGGVEFDAGRYAPAEEMYKEALKYDSNSTGAYYALGNVAYRLGRVDDALANWEKTVQVGTGTEEAKFAGDAAGEVYYNRGVEFYDKGQMKEALDAWVKVNEVAPGSHIAGQAQARINQAFGGQ